MVPEDAQVGCKSPLRRNAIGDSRRHVHEKSLHRIAE